MNEIKIFCEGEEIKTIEFEDKEIAEDYFDTYPLDDMADHIEMWGYDEFGDWELLDERNASPSEW